MHRTADIEIEIRLHTEFFEHASAQVFIVVLTGVTEDHLVPPFFEFFKQRNLLNDIRLRSDENQMDMTVWPSGNFVEEPSAGKRDLIHRTARV